MKLIRGNLCNLWLIQKRRKTPLHADKMPYVKDVKGVDNRLTLLWFTEGGPTRAWDEVFANRVNWPRRPAWAGSSWWCRSSRHCPAPTCMWTSCAEGLLIGRAAGHKYRMSK
jgi:hypothetical protein